MSSSLRSVRDKPKPLGQRARLENGPAWTGSALPRHPAPTHCTVKPAIVVTLLVAIGWATRHPSNHAMASVCPRRVAVHVCVTVCAVDVTLCATVCDVNKSETVKLARYVCTMQCDRSDDVCSCVAHEFDLPQEALKSSLRPTRMPFRPLPLYSRRGRNPSGVLCSACFLGGVVTLRAAHSAWQPHAVCCGLTRLLGRIRRRVLWKLRFSLGLLMEQNQSGSRGTPRRTLRRPNRPMAREDGSLAKSVRGIVAKRKGGSVTDHLGRRYPGHFDAGQFHRCPRNPWCCR